MPVPGARREPSPVTTPNPARVLNKSATAMKDEIKSAAHGAKFAQTYELKEKLGKGAFGGHRSVAAATSSLCIHSLTPPQQANTRP